MNELGFCFSYNIFLSFILMLIQLVKMVLEIHDVKLLDGH